MTEEVRAYIYRVLFALQPLAIFYGVATESEAALWIGFVGAILGNGLAVAYTSTAPKA